MPISKSIKTAAKFAKDFYQNGGNGDKDVYDDDFDGSTDSEREDSSKLESSQNKKKDQSFTSTRYGSVYSEPLDSARRGYGSGYSKATTGNHKRMKGNRKGRDASRPPQSSNVIAQRVLSARRNKINSLQNLVLELQNEVDQLRIENRDLKRSSRIQEKVIKRLDDDEADLPLLLQKHNSEVRNLKEKLKKQKDRSERLHEDVKKKDLELLKLRDKVRKYEEIMKEKRLDERERLQHKLEKLESELGEKEGKISELEKVVKLSEKVRIREIKERNDKYKKAIEELRRLENMQRDLQDKFKEKEKELQTQNIYSQRIALKRKTMRSEELTLDSRIEDTPLSSRNDNPGTTRLRGLKDNETVLSYNENIEKSELGSADVNVETMMSALRKKEEELEKILEEEHRRKQFEEDKRKLQEMEDKIKLKQEEIKHVGERKEDERRRLEKERRSEEEKMLEQRRWERLNKEEEERKVKEIEDEKKKIAEIEYRARQREEERKIIEALEYEKAKEEQRRTMEEVSKESAMKAEVELSRKLAEQKARQKNLEDQLKIENDMKSDDVEAQRKKEILLARMKALDEGKNISNNHSNVYKGFQTSKVDDGNSQLVTKNEKKKPIFLQDSTNDDKENGVKHIPLDFSAKRRGSKTEYNFKAADENLHRGLPSHHDVNTTNQQDLTLGTYSRSVGSGGKKRVSQYKNNEKKTDEDYLFFDTNAKSSPGQNSKREVKKETEDFPFFDTKKTKASLANDKPDRSTIFQINSDKNRKPELNRNRTKSISDDDSQMFTIGGKKPDSSKPERNSGDSAKDRKSTAGSGKRVFGGYEPTFGNSGSANSTDVMSPGSDPFADDGPRFGRRQGQQKSSGDLGDMALSPNNDENKPNNFTKTLFDSGRRKADQVGTTAVKAIDSFVDDDIEEMVLT